MSRTLPVALALAMALATPAGAQPWTPNPTPGAHPPGENRFHGPLQDALEFAARADRPLVVYFTGASCEPCSVMGRRVLTQPDVRAAMQPFVEVVVDVDTPEGADAARVYGIDRPPAILVLRPDGTELREARMVGPQRARDIVWRLGAAVQDPSLPPGAAAEPAPPDVRPEPKGLSMLLLAVIVVAGLSLFLATRRRRTR